MMEIDPRVDRARRIVALADERELLQQAVDWIQRPEADLVRVALEFCEQKFAGVVKAAGIGAGDHLRGLAQDYFLARLHGRLDAVETLLRHELERR